MMWYWVLFGIVFSFLLFLIIYLLDHWTRLDRKQRAVYVCNIVTMLLVSFTAWITIEISMSLRQQQEKLENSQIESSIFQEYEKENGKKIYIRSNQKEESKIEIRKIEKGTKVFYEYYLKEHADQ